MPRVARMFVKDSEAAYHIISRTALDGFVLGDPEKEQLLKIFKHMSGVYFVELQGFCIMGNHFHLLVRMRNPKEYSNAAIRKRLRIYYADEQPKITPAMLANWRRKLCNLSEYVKDIKQRFSRYYNREHNRRGYFWGDRFKSVIVERGETLINCLAYIDLNPVRAGLVKRPEDYRWSSLGYHVQTNNAEAFLSVDYGLEGADKESERERLKRYREFVYEKGALGSDEGHRLDESVLRKARKKGYEFTTADRFRYRTRYFTDSGIIGTRAFVQRFCRVFKVSFAWKAERKPKPVTGIDGLYSLKRLSEVL